jgi:hypothetical protein
LEEEEPEAEAEEEVLVEIVRGAEAEDVPVAGVEDDVCLFGCWPVGCRGWFCCWRKAAIKDERK